MAAAQITKDSIDLGIVVRDLDAALAFYRDTLGLPFIADMPMPGGGGTMTRIACGTTVLKLVHFDKEPASASARGGIAGANGYRYFTITVSNLGEIVDACNAAGCKVPVSAREIRPGVQIAIVEDPDGNWVEFLQAS
jgi:catechol 2,3-dioxygenase-like lactoylglutathione lyase family enzyme